MMTSIVPIKNGINFRDLGGISTVDGRKIRPGMLYRSGAFCHLTESDTDFISNNLNLHYVLDYRDLSEIEKLPNQLWSGANYIHAPANPLNDDVTASLTSNLDQDVQALKQNSPYDFMIKLYQLLPFNNPAYQKLAWLLLHSDGKPLVQHCAVGKDRTGVGVALTLFALGVSEAVIMDDYLLTEKTLASYRARLFEQYKDIFTPEKYESSKFIFAAKQEYLSAAIEAIKDRYDTIDNWLAKEYQLTDDNKKILRDRYLV